MRPTVYFGVGVVVVGMAHSRSYNSSSSTTFRSSLDPCPGAPKSRSVRKTMVATGSVTTHFVARASIERATRTKPLSSLAVGGGLCRRGSGRGAGLAPILATTRARRGGATGLFGRELDGGLVFGTSLWSDYYYS